MLAVLHVISEGALGTGKRNKAIWFINIMQRFDRLLEYNVEDTYDEVDALEIWGDEWRTALNQRTRLTLCQILPLGEHRDVFYSTTIRKPKKS